MAITSPQKNSPVDGLEKVLLEQLNLYCQYRDLLKADGALMTALKIDELEKNNKAKSTILLKIQAMDQARESWVGKVADLYKLTREKVRLSDICAAAGGDVAKRLNTLRDALQNTMSELKVIQ